MLNGGGSAAVPLQLALRMRALLRWVREGQSSGDYRVKRGVTVGRRCGGRVSVKECWADLRETKSTYTHIIQITKRNEDVAFQIDEKSCSKGSSTSVPIKGTFIDKVNKLHVMWSKIMLNWQT